MKKLLTLLLTLLLFAMVGCSNSSNSTMEEQPISTEDYPIADIQQDEQDIAIVGGYTVVEDGTITDELKQLFNSAFDGFTGASYEPVELVATQVVAGTNYKFLANGTKTTNPIIKGTYYIYINKDLEGNISVLDIETIEESQEETKQEISKEQDPTKLSYWVVFYNPDGHELYRTIMKYGSTPVYEGDTPSYWDSDNWYKFVCWTDKQGNEIKQFKPITGNTYIYAKYKMGGDLKKKNTISATPAIINCTHTSSFLAYCNSLTGDADIDVYELRTNGYKKIGNIPNLSPTNFSGYLEEGKWSHTDTNPLTGVGIVFISCENNNSHQFEGPCLDTTPIIRVDDRAGGAYFHWSFYEYDSISSNFVLNSTLSNSSSWMQLPGSLVVGKYYHVSTTSTWSYWKANDPTRNSSTYTECYDAAIDHQFSS